MSLRLVGSSTASLEVGQVLVSLVGLTGRTDIETIDTSLSSGLRTVIVYVANLFFAVVSASINDNPQY